MSTSSFIDLSLFCEDTSFVDAHQVSAVDYLVEEGRPFLHVLVDGDYLKSEMILTNMPKLDQSGLLKNSKRTENALKKSNDLHNEIGKMRQRQFDQGTADAHDANYAALRLTWSEANAAHKKAQDLEEEFKKAFQKELKAMVLVHAKSQVEAFCRAVSAARAFK